MIQFQDNEVQCEPISIPLSRLQAFRYDEKSSLRWGQAFHQYMGLEKVTQGKVWCDRLYQADNDVAKAMVHEVLDYAN